MHPDYRPPRPGKITSRKSTITGMFFATLTPSVEPSDEDVREALSILGMTEGECVCAYCGGQMSEWDHFRPITINREPTGYISEIANLVPSCGKCNQSKGNKNWRDWIVSANPLSPKSRGVPDIAQRIECLSNFERWRVPIKLDYRTIFGDEAWERHLQHLHEVIALLTKADAHVGDLRSRLAAALREQRASAMPQPDDACQMVE